jgi:predicted transposase YbfD/YdcC
MLFTGRDREFEGAIQRENASGLKPANHNPLDDVAQKNPTIPVEPIFREPTFRDFKNDYVCTTEKGHGRIEKREYFLVEDVSFLRDKDLWANIRSVGMVRSTVTHIKSGHISIDDRFYICSITDVHQFAQAVRHHWGIESTHWIRYVLSTIFEKYPRIIWKAVWQKYFFAYIKYFLTSKYDCVNIRNAVRIRRCLR